VYEGVYEGVYERVCEGVYERVNSCTSGSFTSESIFWCIQGPHPLARERCRSSRCASTGGRVGVRTAVGIVVYAD
jgi:hypothetical protein